MEFKPLFDQLVVKVDTAPQEIGGIIIPDMVEDATKEGTVIAIGNGADPKNGQPRPMTVEVNNRVIFTKTAGVVVKIEGEDYLILREEEVIGILED